MSSDRCTLYLGDCLEILKALDAESVDMVFADPPYRLSNGGITNKGGRCARVDKGDWDRSEGLEKDFQFHINWLSACRRVLKPNGTLWVSGTYHSIYTCGFALQVLGYHVLNEIIWYKRNAPPNIICRLFIASHETLIWAAKSRKSKHIYNDLVMRTLELPDDMLKKPGKQMRSVWDIGRPRSEEFVHGKHPTQKPQALIERILQACTNVDDLVLDPFMGSGTTGAAAAHLGRKFIGIEQDDTYFSIAGRRLGMYNGIT